MAQLLDEDTYFVDDTVPAASIDNEEHRSEASEHQDRTAKPSRPRRRADANKLLFDFISLQIFDFKRDIVILIELPNITGADMYEHIPVRNIVDTGSNEENFISRKVLTEHGMDSAKILELSEAEQTERAIATVAGDFTPAHEVTLYWHRLKDTNQRRARFLVVDSPNFDVIIGNRTWAATEGLRHGFLAIPGYQSWSMYSTLDWQLSEIQLTTVCRRKEADKESQEGK